MAFIFDSTVGGVTSNSFVSVTEADDYFAGRYENSLWRGTAELKQRLLTTASLRIDAERYSGRKSDQNQSLQFPRDVVFDRDGYPYDNIIPQNLKYAVCELVYWFLSKDERLFTEEQLHDAAMLDNWSVGPLSYAFKAAKQDKLPNTVVRELKALGPDVWLGESTVTQLFR